MGVNYLVPGTVHGHLYQSVAAPASMPAGVNRHLKWIHPYIHMWVIPGPGPIAFWNFP